MKVFRTTSGSQGTRRLSISPLPQQKYLSQTSTAQTFPFYLPPPTHSAAAPLGPIPPLSAVSRDVTADRSAVPRVPLPPPRWVGSWHTPERRYTRRPAVLTSRRCARSPGRATGRYGSNKWERRHPGRANDDRPIGAAEMWTGRDTAGWNRMGRDGAGREGTGRRETGRRDGI